MLSAFSQSVNDTTGRRQMTVLARLQPICELAHRASNGIEVALLWNRTTDDLHVRVSDARTGVLFKLVARSDNALDVFYHPYSYAAARGVAYDQTPLAAGDRPMPLSA